MLHLIKTGVKKKIGFMREEKVAPCVVVFLACGCFRVGTAGDLEVQGRGVDGLCERPQRSLRQGLAGGLRAAGEHRTSVDAARRGGGGACSRGGVEAVLVVDCGQDLVDVGLEHHVALLLCQHVLVLAQMPMRSRSHARTRRSEFLFFLGWRRFRAAL